MTNFSEDQIKRILEVMADSNKPVGKRVAYILSLIVCFALGFALSEFLYYRYRQDIEETKENSYKEINIVKKSADDEIKATKESTAKLISQKEQQNIDDQNAIIDKYDYRMDQNNSRLQEIIIDNARSEANHIIEMANALNYIPDSLIAFFNTYPKDRSFLQVSNQSKFPRSNKNYSYSTIADQMDSLALFFYIHNTSGNSALNPVINLKYQQIDDTLVCFTAYLSARNTNVAESGQAYIQFKKIDNRNKLFGFRIIRGVIYESRDNVSRGESVRIIHYPQSINPNINISINLSDIPPINFNEEDQYGNQFSVVLNLVPVYYQYLTK